ncbi:ATP synthase subunit beta [Bienertia sinuspersici]
MEKLNIVLNGDPNFFDSKPIIIKIIPIWVRLPQLDIKYWGEKCLAKIFSIIGDIIKDDNPTKSKEN